MQRSSSGNNLRRAQWSFGSYCVVIDSCCPVNDGVCDVQLRSLMCDCIKCSSEATAWGIWGNVLTWQAALRNCRRLLTVSNWDLRLNEAMLAE